MHTLSPKYVTTLQEVPIKYLYRIHANIANLVGLNISRFSFRLIAQILLASREIWVFKGYSPLQKVLYSLLTYLNLLFLRCICLMIKGIYILPVLHI
jgi:hypothetical protein